MKSKHKESVNSMSCWQAGYHQCASVILSKENDMELKVEHIADIVHLMKTYRVEVGLLINFGSKSLTFKRLVL